MKQGIARVVRNRVRRVAIGGGLEIAQLLARSGLMTGARGSGAIFTLHHVRPRAPRAFDPNAHLEITPTFLEEAILTLKRDGYRFVALQDLPESLVLGDPRPVACFTLDDGYRNNLEYALPVFEQHGVPFTVFVSGGYVDRTHTLWWETLADMLSPVRDFRFDFGSGIEAMRAVSNAEKQAVFDRISAYVRGHDEEGAVGKLNELACAQGIDPLAITTRLTLDAAGLRCLLQNPLANLGAHTISHRALAPLSDAEAQREMSESAARVEAIAGRWPATFAYPYGDRHAVSERDCRLAERLGFTVAVTTQPATLSADTVSNLHTLPRISLNGHFQSRRHVTALASGIPFRLMAG
ncbi:polysaccharide deacetylase family protein [Sinorhizobium terangae]|uniref:Chitooligosaccharide deacetylase n=1 Tax=Sinorhizobium terangae TaxID=110322 RepID=A0A6N7LML8_SINTE|nr:polysaccharide deacetylase family protein [Sinorhizobium terangae]MBB4184843.1 peptidoglycan/xylan/chitin deacetylase (PgdA/CDA1 family) [Sinorhizobium terangae]MQX18469.1 polysaccharide deacetylase family protein [Sinorhizobium terangae]WFU48323.1 polysaccharide deacetylase family protein [Sinorhizobium terangae]